MSSPDRGAGPQITQDVLYNNGGVITAATIYGVNANGTVNLVWFGSGGATSATSVPYNPNLSVSPSWAYPQFQ